MIGTPAAKPSVRRSVVLAAFALAGLTGCAGAGEPAPAPTTEKTADSSGKPASPESAMPDTLSFADGSRLPETAHVEWGDGLMLDDGWTATSPDDGNGGWMYGTADGSCSAQFWQGFTADVATTPGDDRSSSDALLGALLQADAATIAPHAVDGAFTYQLGGSPTVEHRRVMGGEGERTWVMAARAFTAVGAGLYLIVDCTGTDVEAVLDEVITKSPIVVS